MGALSYLCIQLHNVSHLVPAKAHKAAVILRTVPPHHNIGLKVSLPLHSVGSGGCPPFGKVSWCMAFSPHMISVRRKKESSLPEQKCTLQFLKN